MNQVTPGKTSTEFKVTLLNYIAGLFLIMAGTWLQHKGHDSTTLLGMGTTLLIGNGVAYGAMRTSVKNIAAKTAVNQPKTEVVAS